VNAVLFAATVASVYFTAYDKSADGVLHAVQFTAALLGILLAHEFGHYVAARIHKVDASLPFFIPMPLSPFGTMGAVINMRQVIPTRRALLDIGAAGPLAGLAIAIPLYAWGVAHSTLIPLDGGGGGSFVSLGDSLLARGLDRWFGPPVPEGMDLLLSPVAYAGWAGMFVTMINLFPLGQLDAGHVAYALLGPRQNAIAPWVHRSMLAFFFVSLASFVARDVRAGIGLYHLDRAVNNSISWLLWFEVFAVLGNVSSADGPDKLGIRTRIVATLALVTLAGLSHYKSTPLLWITWFAGVGLLVTMEVRWGALRKASKLTDHPPTGAEPLGLGRAIVAVVTLAFFALLFMVTPFSM
jgi:membrane-associated protease RseP (regulator of RpoE activity)